MKEITDMVNITLPESFLLNINLNLTLSNSKMGCLYFTK